MEKEIAKKEIVKIRASQAYKLLVEPKTKDARLKGELSETAKTYIEELYLYEKFGYKEEVVTNELIKGIETEELCLSLAQDCLGGGELRIKNRQQFENDYIKGTPDIIMKDCVEDVKSCYTIKTYFNSALTINYYTQLQCYMALTNIHRARLIYCLVETPQYLIADEKLKFYYKFRCDENHPEYIRITNQIERNHNANLSKEDRIKVYEFDYNQEFMDKLYKKIEKAREYFNSLTIGKKIIDNPVNDFLI